MIWSLFFLCSLPVLTKSFDSENRSAEKKELHNFFSISYGEGDANGLYESGRARISKIAYEYRFHSESGFEIRLDSGQTKLKASDNGSSALLLWAFLNSNPASKTDSLGDSVFLGLALAGSSAESINYNTVSMNYKQHVIGDKAVDPYLGIGISAGFSTGYERTTVAGGRVLGGIMFKVENAYFFAEGEYSIISLGSYFGQVQNKIFSLGAGFRY